TSTLNSVLLKFTGQPGVNPLSPTQTRIVGTFTGTLRGATPLGQTSAQLPGLPAVITSSGTAFVNFAVEVAQNSKKMSLFTTSAIGTGVVQNNNSYKFSLLGTGDNSGEVLLVSGVLGDYVNRVGVGTNTVTV